MEIHGKKILGFKFEDIEIESFSCDFYVNGDNRIFDIYIDDIQTTKKLSFYLEKYLTAKKDYLFCVDENEQYFTLYDCEIELVNKFKDKFRMVWNKCLLGYHIENVKDARIKSAKYIVNTKDNAYPFNMFVGRNDIMVLNESVNIQTDWNQENNEFRGVSISISLKESMSISEVEIIVLRLLEIIFLEIGFYPHIITREMTTTDNKTFNFIDYFAAYGNTIKPYITHENVLHIKDNFDFSSAYDKWYEIREKEPYTFNLFSYLTTEDSCSVMEVPVATCIQCLDGYFHAHHKDNINRFNGSARDKIISEIKNLMESSDKMKSICKKRGLELEYIKGLVGESLAHFNKYSTAEILEVAINWCNETKRLFKYESDNKIIDLLIKKAKGHRNWLSHVSEQNQYFKNEENDMAYEKLRLLFRLILLHDIGAETTDQSLDNIVTRIDEWYKSNKLE